MYFTLNQIDWTALGAIITFIMAIAAFLTLFFSIRENNKGRNLQIKLIQQQQAQQKLDDMVNNVLKISNNITPFEILEYSSKLTSNTLTEEDRKKLEKFAVDDNLNNTNLSLQMMRLNNYQSAKAVCKCLNVIRSDYGLWSSTVGVLSKIIGQESLQSDENIRQAVIQIISDISKRCMEIAPQYQHAISEIIRKETILTTRALKVMTIFDAQLARSIQKQQRILDQELIRFVSCEQQKIDKIPYS